MAMQAVRLTDMEILIITTDIIMPLMGITAAEDIMEMMDIITEMISIIIMTTVFLIITMVMGITEERYM